MPDPSRRSAPGTRWLFRMAWRDSRGKRLLLLLFTFSILFGIGSIVAIHSVRENLQRIVDEQARSLLGADIVLQTRRAPTPELERLIGGLPGDKVRELRFRSMAWFPEREESRFVQVRAIDGSLPFYGKMETDPAGDSVRQPGPGQALIEESLMLLLNLKPGDPVMIGEAEYRIGAALVRMAGESEITGFFAPRIYLPMEGIEETGLIQTGSLIRYRRYLAAEDAELETLKSRIEEAQEGLFVEEAVEVETVADRKRSLERILNNLLDFLNLTGFAALLLGGIGIIGAVNVYLQTKRETIAVLRCLGASVRQAFTIYLLQIMAFGLVGALAGTALGTGIQFILPTLLQSFLPFEVTMRASWSAIVTGLTFGGLVVFLSALVPLLGVRHISPLGAIRSMVETGIPGWRDPWKWLVGSLLAAGLLLFLVLQSRRVGFALSFVLALLISLGLLALVALVLRLGLRRFRPNGSPYPFRLALSNLYRPNNRTLLIVVSLGMGVLLINTLLLVRDGLLQQVRIEPVDDAANVIMLDVQEDQREGLIGLLEAEGLAAQDVLPVVTMRVDGIKGRSLAEWREEPDSPVSNWVYTWEFRNTYRDHVLDNAEVVEGRFTPRHEGGEPFPISLSENVLEDFGVGLGDSITWDVQGIRVETVVDSVRRIRWQAGRQNFNVVFPLNTIEAAPTVFAVSVKTGSRLETARLQRKLADRFSNISLIDLSLVFDSLQEILDKASFVIQFMAGFTIGTGLIVLAGSLIGGRYQRIREGVLFRTIGASSRFVRLVLGVEYLLLGLIASLSGILLSLAAGWALFRFVFEMPFQIEITGALLVGAGLTTLTLLTGWLTSHGIAAQPPLVVLRKE